MSENAIKVDKLSKKYRLGVHTGNRTFREAVMNLVKSPARRVGSLKNGPRNTEPDLGHIWALKDLSLEIKPGEVVGIIGGNGAGKSTLLKILTRITEPTSGQVELLGRVGSLLEVGTGFHSELTGRENIYLYGAVLGMGRHEVTRKFDDIVSFAEMGDFMDTPVKRYSSGMYMRLAFAVAAHLEPDILLVDEVLAVGDAVFQRRCLGKMGDFASTGRTILFVSHNLAAVRNLCTRAIWLKQGKVRADTDPGQAISAYLDEALGTSTRSTWKDMETAPGNDEVRIRHASVSPLGEDTEQISLTTPICLDFEYWNLKPDTHLNLSLILYDHQGTLVLNTAPIHEKVWYGRAFPRGLYRSRVVIPALFLNDGMYSLELLVVKDQAHVLFRQSEILTFNVADDPGMRGSWHGKWPGVVRPDLEWTTSRVDE